MGVAAGRELPTQPSKLAPPSDGVLERVWCAAVWAAPAIIQQIFLEGGPVLPKQRDGDSLSTG